MPSDTYDSGKSRSGRNGRREIGPHRIGIRQSAKWRSSRNLPGGAVFGVLHHDAHGGKLIADAIGFFEVFSGASGRPRFNQTLNLSFVDGDRCRTEGGPFGRWQLK